MKKLYFEGMIAMEERSLRITGADKTFINKITNTLTKLLIPTKIGINGMLISIKRNSLIKAYENYMQEENYDKEELEKKYDSCYEAYLEALDKYVMDSIYKKVKNNTASEFEQNALSKYYEVTSLKESEYIEYKYRKQKYLLELDYEGIKVNGKEKIKEKYEKFYISKMDSLYKSILKNYSIKVADNISNYDSTKEWIYTKIFYTLEDYIQNILPLKLELNQDESLKSVVSDYEKYESYTVGKLDTKDNIEKNMILLGISRKLFTHSLPLIVAEQCYEKLLKDARSLVQDTKIATKREKAYSMLINLIEDYNVKLLSTKVYWESPKERDQYKEFWKKYQDILKLKETDFIEYVKQKEILFIKNDIKNLDNGKIDYSKLMKYYKRKLVDYVSSKFTPKELVVDVNIIQGDSASLDTKNKIQDRLEIMGEKFAQFLILHPPYDDIIKFSDKKEDLSNCATTEEFYELFKKVAKNGYDLLEQNRFAALIIGDKYANSRYISLGFECQRRMEELGFVTKAVIVKNITGNEKAKGKTANLWRYRALSGGFNIFEHEYIMIFQKTKLKKVRNTNS